MCPVVGCPVGHLCELAIAQLALVRLDSAVQTKVNDEVGLLSKLVLANVALEWSFSGVYSIVSFKICGIGERLRAYVTSVRLRSRPSQVMRESVSVEESFCRKCGPTLATSVAAASASSHFSNFFGLGRHCFRGRVEKRCLWF